MPRELWEDAEDVEERDELRAIVQDFQLFFCVDAGGNRILAFWHTHTAHSTTHVRHITFQMSKRLANPGVQASVCVCMCAVWFIAIFSHHQQTVKNGGILRLTITPFRVCFGDVRISFWVNGKCQRNWTSSSQMRRDNPMAKLMLADCYVQIANEHERNRGKETEKERTRWKDGCGTLSEIVFEIRNWFAWIGHVK